MSQPRPVPRTRKARTSCGFCEGGSGQKAEADVTVHVFGLAVAKQMHGISFTRTCKRALGDPSMPNTKVSADQPGSYSVPVTVTVADGDWLAGGTITIPNDTPLAAHGIAVIHSLPFAQGR